MSVSEPCLIEQCPPGALVQHQGTFALGVVMAPGESRFDLSGRVPILSLSTGLICGWADGTTVRQIRVPELAQTAMAERRRGDMARMALAGLMLETGRRSVTLPDATLDKAKNEVFDMVQAAGFTTIWMKCRVEPEPKP